METYSVSFRVQRHTVEYGYVSVPITGDVIIEQPDGTGRIDVKRITEQAVELAQSPNLRWFPESREVQLHPIQKAPDPDER